jgi:predicted transcriptional regulator
MKVVLSIKPEFAEKIFQGTKKYEFRRAIFKNPKIKMIIVYASSPVQKVIGEFEIDKIISHDLDTLWDKTKECSGITKEYFFQYFGDKENGFAIKIKKAKLYDTPKCLKEDYNLVPPQSFSYFSE